MSHSLLILSQSFWPILVNLLLGIPLSDPEQGKPVWIFMFWILFCPSVSSLLGRKGRTKRRKSSYPVCLISGLMSWDWAIPRSATGTEKRIRYDWLNEVGRWNLTRICLVYFRTWWWIGCKSSKSFSFNRDQNCRQSITKSVSIL